MLWDYRQIDSVLRWIIVYSVNTGAVTTYVMLHEHTVCISNDLGRVVSVIIAITVSIVHHSGY